MKSLFCFDVKEKNDKVSQTLVAAESSAQSGDQTTSEYLFMHQLFSNEEVLKVLFSLQICHFSKSAIQIHFFIWAVGTKINGFLLYN